MTTTSDEIAPATAPQNGPETAVGPVVGQVQTDRFCEGCGYNLHTQDVMRDGRLGILVSRCPECGRFSASGDTTTASKVWLSRFATAMLAGWVFFLLLLFGLFTLFLGMTAYGHLHSNLTDGRGLILISGSPPSYFNRYHYIPRSPPAPDTEEAHKEKWEQAWMVVFAVGLGFGSGGAFAVFLWHCKGWRAVFIALPAVLGCSVAAILWTADSASWLIREWGLWQIFGYCAMEVIAAGAGFQLGRPIARFALRILVPPRPRQHLAFLWITDGKRLPTGL